MGVIVNVGRRGRDLEIARAGRRATRTEPFSRMIARRKSPLSVHTPAIRQPG
jgi:hypothetical protein